MKAKSTKNTEKGNESTKWTFNTKLNFSEFFRKRSESNAISLLK